MSRLAVLMIAACTTLIIGERSVRADPASVALFYAGRILSIEGRHAEACPYYQQSLAREPTYNTQVALAVCHAAIGRTATAIEELLAAAEMARANGWQARVDIALKEVEKLRPQLARLRVDAPGTTVPGLSVRHGSASIATGSDLAVDPGPYAIEVTAAGYRPWSTEVTAIAGQVVTVQIPALEPIPIPPVIRRRRFVPATLPPRASGLDNRRVVALSLGGVALTWLSAAVALELHARPFKAMYDDPSLSVDEQDAAYDDGNPMHVGAQYLGWTAVALGATSACLWFFAHESDAASSLRVVPDAGDSSASLALWGRF